MQHYMIFGYGGIGKALVTTLVAQKQIVTVVSRKHHRTLPKGCRYLAFSELAENLITDPPDYVINTIGILQDDTHMPEKKLAELTKAWLLQNIEVNVWPAVEIAKALNTILKVKPYLVFMSLSARVGSISDNRLGGWYSYRMSKAALNMLIKTTAIEWQRLSPKAAIVGYHPGTVATPLSAPFQHNVPKEKLFTPELAADHLLTVLHQVTPESSGQLFDWQGKTIAC